MLQLITSIWCNISIQAACEIVCHRGLSPQFTFVYTEMVCSGFGFLAFAIIAYKNLLHSGSTSNAEQFINTYMNWVSRNKQVTL